MYRPLSFTHSNATVFGLSYKTCCNFFLSCSAVTVHVSTTVLPQYFCSKKHFPNKNEFTRTKQTVLLLQNFI